MILHLSPITQCCPRHDLFTDALSDTCVGVATKQSGFTLYRGSDPSLAISDLPHYSYLASASGCICLLQEAEVVCILIHLWQGSKYLMFAIQLTLPFC